MNHAQPAFIQAMFLPTLLQYNHSLFQDGFTMIWLFSQTLFDVIIVDWRNLIVDFLHLL